MVTLKLSTEQVIELIRQLSPSDKKNVLDALSSDVDFWWGAQLAQGDERLRALSAERGLDWDKMSEDERELFVDQLLHEK